MVTFVTLKATGTPEVALAGRAWRELQHETQRLLYRVIVDVPLLLHWQNVQPGCYVTV
jgi:hypothetical protein